MPEWSLKTLDLEVPNHGEHYKFYSDKDWRREETLQWEDTVLAMQSEMKEEKKKQKG